jgi:transcriptional regulator with XRE-family HTH domain
MFEFEYPKTTEEKESVERLRSRMNVGRLIARWRMRRRLTQDQLARLAGTKQSRISELESLNGNVRFDTLDRISRALGLEVTLQERATHNAQWFTDACPTNWTSTVASSDTEVFPTATTLIDRRIVSNASAVI